MTAVSYQQHSPIVIKGNGDLTPDKGVTGGSGTASNPFIIEGWEINASQANGITIVNTTAYVLIRNVLIYSGLSGVVLTGVVHTTLQSAVVRGNSNTGVLVENSSGVSLTGNNVTKNGCCFRPTNLVSLGPGILLDHSSTILVSGNNIALNVGDGLVLNGTQNIRTSSNNISRNSGGIRLRNANSTTITGNTIEYSTAFRENSGSGLAIRSSYNTTLTGNTFVSDAISLWPDSLDGEFASLSISADNVVDGKPVYYYKDCKGLNVEGIPVGQLFVFNCDGVRLGNLTFENDETGITLRRVHGTLITHNAFSSARLGIAIYGSTYVSVVANNFTGITSLSLFNVATSIFLFNVLNMTITANLFTDNNGGITDNYQSTFDGLVYHNNFVNVTNCCDLGSRWDKGYPGGGNYYSDYNGTDNCSGPRQNICPDPDGIWDLPNPDRLFDQYQLAKPYSFPSDSASPSWSSNSTVTATKIGSTSLTLNWSQAQDDAEVVVYRVYQGDAVVAYVPGRYHSYQITGLSTGTTYAFRIEAGDVAGNWSTGSLSVTASTTGLGPGFWYLLAVVLGAISLLLVLLWYRKKSERWKSSSPVGELTKAAPTLTWPSRNLQRYG